MALTGAWKQARSIRTDARKWGTGINPIHSEEHDYGRMTADGGRTEPVSALLTTEYDCDGWSNDDLDGYGETPQSLGTDQHPDYGDSLSLARADAGDFPQWGPYENGVPGGSSLRTERHGVGDQQTPNQVPTETVSEGWRNKVHGDVEDSVSSDTSQLFINTSQVQRDQTRAGSQRGDGSASDYDAPIRSRITGQRIKVYSDSERRREDMRPKTQTQRAKAWWNRQAGTGDPAMMDPNASMEVAPRSRKVPADPYVPPAVVDSPNYGYSDEDVLPYV